MSVASVLVWTAYLGPFLALAAPNGLAPLLALAVAGAALSLWRQRRLPSIPLAPAALLGGIVVWGLITLIWSLEPLRGLVAVGRLGFMFLGGLLLAAATGLLGHEERRRIGTALCIGVFVALALIVTEIVSGGVLTTAGRGLFGLSSYEPFLLNRSATVMVVLLWPALMALRTAVGTGPSIIGLVIGALALTITESTTAALASVTGLTVAFSGLLNRGTAVVARLLMAGLLIALLGGPAYSLGVTLFGHHEIKSGTASSMLHRLYIWDFVAGRIREKPVFGWGLESSKSVPGGHTAKPVDNGKSPTEELIISYKSQLLPLHPHNAGLQVWLELGLPGILLLAGFVVWLMRAIVRRRGDAFTSALCMAQVISTFVIAELSYGVWQSWWVSTIALGAIYSAALSPLALHRTATEPG